MPEILEGEAFVFVQATSLKLGVFLDSTQTRVVCHLQILWREPTEDDQSRYLYYCHPISGGNPHLSTVSTTEEQTTASGASGEFHISVDYAGAGHGAIVVFKPFGPSLGNLAMGQNPAALTST